MAGHVVLLSGGLGGARLAPPLAKALGSGRLTVVVNVGDDFTWHGLRVCPDLDAVTYALAGVSDRKRGYGLKGDTFTARETLAKLGAPAWFGVGDRDLALHLHRTAELAAGRALSDVTAQIAARLGAVTAEIVPAAETPAETELLLDDGRCVHFQEWYVREKAEPIVREARLARVPASPRALAAIERASVIVFAPSNPVSSVGTILALEGIRERIRGVPRRICVSPVVSRKPSRDPKIARRSLARRRLLAASGERDTPPAIARRYAELATDFLLDRADRADEREIRTLAVNAVCADLLDDRRLTNALIEEMRFK